ncbi:hypothetical protein CVT26_005412 [Gymnopilus dilepis]|uniref:Xrn1 helical domain-containing protein n=1 Tax=Gymnopilus dilepis TaxID=231916 RepID=A0A409WWQ6_9AGAR|nr:hypothetical protein CVT26_005412 [Gymnopilus dilepis]
MNFSSYQVILKAFSARLVECESHHQPPKLDLSLRRLKHPQPQVTARQMDEWKRGHFEGVLDTSYDDENAMHDIVYGYVEFLKWVMHYYFNEIASWIAYQNLIYDVNLPILDFRQSLNKILMVDGKKQDWEAIVKIPNIDQERLLIAMVSRGHRLPPEEKRRNKLGTSTKFRCNPEETTVYSSSLPGFFSPIYRCMEPFGLPTLYGLHLIPGLRQGVALNVEALAGFSIFEDVPAYRHVGLYASVTVSKHTALAEVDPKERGEQLICFRIAPIERTNRRAEKSSLPPAPPKMS